jgi:large subunit ribosomal protein L19
MNKQEILQYVDKKFQKQEPKSFKIGDTVRVHVRITEGETKRVQVFEGVVISMKGHGGARNFTARKVSFGIGVERCFPLNSPTLDKVEVVRSGHVRRAKLYYLRDRVGRSARLEEKDAADVLVAANVPVAAPVAPPKPAASSPEALVTPEEK